MSSRNKRNEWQTAIHTKKLLVQRQLMTSLVHVSNKSAAKKKVEPDYRLRFALELSQYPSSPLYRQGQEAEDRVSDARRGILSSDYFATTQNLYTKLIKTILKIEV